MKFKIFLSSVILAFVTLTSHAMDYGLRFQSHSVSGGKRTALYLGKDNSFTFNKSLSVEFDLAFYDSPHFGQICTIILNNGKSISIVSSVNENNDYNPAVVIDGVVHILPDNFIAEPEKPVKLRFSFEKSSGKAALQFNSTYIISNIDLKDASSASISFGKTANQTAVAPIDIKDIRIISDGKTTHHWELANHDDDICIDCISGVESKAINSRWIIDDHFKWKKIFEMTSDAIVQTAFDPKSSTFFILDEKNLKLLNAKNGHISDRTIGSDNRVMKFSNHLAYDSLSNSLVSYNLKDKTSSRLSIESLIWNNQSGSDAESFFHNHSFATDGVHAYTFGGYGFYMYHNNPFKINLQTGEVTSLPLHPLPEPRTSAASAIVDNKLYIFGGIGNLMGKQEIPSEHYYDLWEYDLTTLEGKKLWEFKRDEKNFLPSSSMYFSKPENAFYLASTLNGCTMIKIKLDEPGFEIVTDDIHSTMDYRDCVLDLYRDEEKKIYYLVLDKRLDDFSHDYAIYEVTYPFADNPAYISLANNNKNRETESGTERSSSWIWIMAAIIVAIIVFTAAILISHKRRSRNILPVSDEVEENSENLPTSDEKEPENQESNIPIQNQTDDEETSQQDNQDIVDTNEVQEVESGQETSFSNFIPSTPSEEMQFNMINKGVQHFKRDKSAISLLGEFNVRDRKGNDVTANFTSRLKDLIILLCLESERSSKGVRQQLIDELIWNDKDERSVKNNRNVYMRKLRVLLAEIGDIEIIFDKGYYIINNKNICVDYIEIQNRLKQLESNEDIDTKIIDETLELLLLGPLLPHTTYQWLDNFKSNYSNASLDMLFKLMNYVKTTNPNDDSLLYKIAETIACHDPLSEEALQIKCRILAKKRMTGLAKKIYERFARDYEESFGEPFKASFAEILK